MRILIRILLVILLTGSAANAVKRFVPVYIQDNHGGSFNFLVQQLNWQQGYTLLLFDQHSDATAIPGSDRMRTVLSQYQYADRIPFLKRWEKQGLVQCFNWIEPLMPHPIEQVIWIAAPSLSATEKKEKQVRVRRFLNANVTIFKRKIADMTPHYRVVSFNELKQMSFLNRPVIASIDLDYCRGFSQEHAGRTIDRIFRYIAKQNLHVLTIAISRPYLCSDSEADRLLYHALKNSLYIINATIEFEPFVSLLPDRSELAKTCYRQQKQVPCFSAGTLSDGCKSLLLNNRERITVHHQHSAWEQLLGRWQRQLSLPYLEIGEGLPSKNITHRKTYTCQQGTPYTITLRNRPLHKGDTIYWKAIVPLHQAYNLCSKRFFAKRAPSVVLYSEKIIAQSTQDLQLPASAIQQLFDHTYHCGTVRIFAEIVTGGDRIRSRPLTITQRLDMTYPGRLTEIMNLPYIFGSTRINDRGNSSADARYGAECSTFLIYGKRAEGVAIPYVDPFNLKRYLHSLYNNISFHDGIAFSRKQPVTINESIRSQGLVLYFGNHVAALFKDNPPLGILDDHDLVLHQLEGFPETITLGELRKGRFLYEVLSF